MLATSILDVVTALAVEDDALELVLEVVAMFYKPIEK
jgi:hypothetical protein